MSKKNRKPKAPKTLWDKVKEFDEALATTIYSCTDEELKAKLVGYADETNKVEKAREDDTDLLSLKEQVKTAGETYSIPLKRNRMKVKLVLQVLTERGKL